MPIDETTRRELDLRLSVERHTQIRLVREVAACAIAAAGQVRDVRLDELENPQLPQPDLLLEILFSVALGPLASRVTSSSLKAVSDRIIAPRMLKGLRVVEVAPGSSRRVPTMQLFEDLRTFRPAFRRAADHEAKRLEWWTDIPKGLVQLGMQKAKTALEHVDQAGKEQAAKRPLEPTAAPGQALRSNIPASGDRPTTAIELAVLRACADQEQAIGIVFDSFQFDLRDPQLTDAKADELRAFLEELAVRSVRDGKEETRLKLFFEACIWPLMFPSIARPVTRVGPRIRGEGGRMVTFQQLLVSTSLVSYWVRRLPHPGGDGLQTFAQFQSRTFGPPQPQLSWLDRDGKPLQSEVLIPMSAFSALVGFFANATERIRELEGRLRSAVPKIYAEATTANALEERFRRASTPL